MEAERGARERGDLTVKPAEDCREQQKTDEDTQTEVGMRSLMPLYEAAEALAVHPDTLVNWSKRGKIRLIKLPSNHLRVHVDDVNRLIKGQGNATG